MDIQWEGVEQLQAALRAKGDRAPLAMAGALFREAETIMGRSRELVPVDTGTLRGSGSVTAPQIAGSFVEVEFGYGGAASDYAVIVHEHMGLSHTNGQAKFLEQPALEAALG